MVRRWRQRASGQVDLHGTRPALSRRLRRVRADRDAADMLALIRQELAVDPEAMLSRGRGNALAALSRQLLIYLLHVHRGRTYRDIAALVGRDRTTITHACAIIEDRREDPAFDETVGRIEAALDRIATHESGADHAAA
jgi:chromosomal replication initiation ATPase DnaA